MTYKQLGFADNMTGRVSMAPLLQVAEESNFRQRYVEGWIRANELAKRRENRKWRPINGEPDAALRRD